VIRKAISSIGRFLGSARLALWLLLFLGVWSALATVIAQGDPSNEAVKTWIATYAGLEPPVRFLGLHDAFMSPVFLAAMALLALSTALCSWRRTRVAMNRSRQLLRSSHPTDVPPQRRDVALRVPDHLSNEEALERGRLALADVGVRLRPRDGFLAKVSPWWSVWGSPIFHWSLLILMGAAVAGLLWRAEGSMAIAVGTHKADKPANYVSVQSGPLRDWTAINRTIQVDSFDPDFVEGGIDRGAVPTVSVLDASGRTVVSQRVYPNMKLHAGSLSISAPTCGLAVTVSFIDPNGAEVSRAVQLVDFSQETTEGTVPVRALVLRGRTGKVLLRMYATVPLDRAADGHLGEWIPKQPRARVVLADGSGQTLVSSVIPVGDSAAIPGGGSVKVAGIGWYSRLSLVDDPSIPFVYGAMILAILGLTLSVAMRQSLIVVWVEGEGPDRHLNARMRLWRNNPTTAEEIGEALSAALGSQKSDSPSMSGPAEGQL
jgi:cytochrome c biogenesis protein ResB